MSKAALGRMMTVIAAVSMPFWPSWLAALSVAVCPMFSKLKSLKRDVSYSSPLATMPFSLITDMMLPLIMVPSSYAATPFELATAMATTPKPMPPLDGRARSS
jgi:hypothetical protein